MPLVGSSNTMISKHSMQASANETFRFIPPENVSTKNDIAKNYLFNTVMVDCLIKREEFEEFITFTLHDRLWNSFEFAHHREHLSRSEILPEIIKLGNQQDHDRLRVLDYKHQIALEYWNGSKIQIVPRRRYRHRYKDKHLLIRRWPWSFHFHSNHHHKNTMNPYRS